MSTNPNFKTSEGKREEFRKYLEKNGIMDALTKVLVNLYEEVDKPENALLYILDKLCIQAGLEPHKQVVAKLEEANVQIKTLEDEIERLKSATKSATSQGGSGSAAELEGENPSTVSNAEPGADPKKEPSHAQDTAQAPEPIIE